MRQYWHKVTYSLRLCTVREKYEAILAEDKLTLKDLNHKVR